MQQDSKTLDVPKKIMLGIFVVIVEIIRVVILCVCLAAVVGCQSLSHRLGINRADYTDAQEMHALKLPQGALAVSKRYDIPEIPENKNPLITNNIPPDYM